MLAVIDDALPAGFEVEMVLGPEDAQKGPFRFLGELSAASAQEARDDRYVAALTVPGRAAVRRGLCGAGGDAGRLLPARGGGARHVPPATVTRSHGRARIGAGSPGDRAARRLVLRQAQDEAMFWPAVHSRPHPELVEGRGRVRSVISGAWVYMLRCADGSYYVGSHRGDDVTARVCEHQQGKSTARPTPSADGRWS